MTYIDGIIQFLKEEANIIVPSSLLSDFECDVKNDKIDYENIKSTIFNVLIDTYNLNAPTIKLISDYFCKRRILLGRNEKDLIKNYLDYDDTNSLIKVCEIKEIYFDDLTTAINLFRIKKQENNKKVIDLFSLNWKNALESNDKSKLIDYIQGIHSKLYFFGSEKKYSLLDLFNDNKNEIEKDLSLDSLNKLKSFCANETKIEYSSCVRKFYNFYIRLLKDDIIIKSNNNELTFNLNIESSEGTIFRKFNTEDFNFVFLNINQKMFNSIGNEAKFYNLILNLIKQTYRLLENHKTFSIKIDNIINEKGQNIKWNLYSIIGIYAEHFIPTIENRKFYDPSLLAINTADYLFENISDEQKKLIKFYFQKVITKDELQTHFSFDVSKILLDFEKIWYGFTFSDCISFSNPECQYSNNELDGLTDKHSILLIFNKYRHDDRKIPCPECGSFKISGNSFPEVGLRSWECKNEKCPSRSKSNRGKRYSYKSNFMQMGYEDNKDIISKNIIEKWRRDIVDNVNEIDMEEMLISYFTFSGDKALFINFNSMIKSSREISQINIEELLDSKVLFENNDYNDYFKNGPYISRFILKDENRIHEDAADISSMIEKSKDEVLINGDSKNILSKIKDNFFSAAVTSPPYYNAREYSQWPNLYLYLSDMYLIIKQIYRTLKPGAVYLYNIGDICGNENTIVSSSMGNKRILLGSYTIYLFKLAGFELLDNILWDKGEPQSNRQKNDGKFTPFYQKPMNVYEHMFLFKKPGANLICNKINRDISWNENIARFSPVIKINNKKENKLGHTAPFPKDIPDFVCKTFAPQDNDIILEPFAGSGTSIISAYKNNRKCVGIELSNEYCDLIKKISNENCINLSFIKFTDNN